MGDKRWTEEDIIKISGEPGQILDKIIDKLLAQPGLIFAAKLGFGVPKIDLVTVNTTRSATGFVLKLPVLEGKISTIPYFQGFGESNFLTDQMLDEAFLLVPHIELSDNCPFTRSPDPLYRLRMGAYESGIATFDREYNVKIFREAKGSLAKQYRRLKMELLDSLLNFGEISVIKGMEDFFEEFKRWVDGEFASLGGKRYMDEDSAKTLVAKILDEANYRNIEMDISEAEIPAEPRPIPVYDVKGTGMYLGDEKNFSMRLSRISGALIKRDF